MRTKQEEEEEEKEKETTRRRRHKCVLYLLTRSETSVSKFH